MQIVFHQGALGDWVLTFPILGALWRQGLTCVVHTAAKGKLAQRLFPGLHRADSNAAAWTALFNPDGAEAVPADVRQLLEEAERIVSFVSNGQDAWAANIRRLAPEAQCFFVDPKPPEKWDRHICEWYFQQLDSQGLKLPMYEPALRYEPMGPLVVHPGSGGRAKCWPIERFEKVIARLRNQGWHVQPIVGEVELEQWPREQLERWRRDWAVRCLSDLDELADVLEGAMMYVGNDSGPTHLAAQMGLPTVALFGPTSPRLWRPRGPMVRVLAPSEPTAMTWLEPDQVLDALVSLRRELDRQSVAGPREA